MKIGVIGAGHMGSILVNSLKNQGSDIFVCDHNQIKVDRLVEHESCFQSTGEDICEICDVVLLAVRPQDLSDCLKSHKSVLSKRENLLLASVVAGVKCETIQKIIGTKVPIMRMMPNVPLEVKFGAIPYCLKDVKDETYVKALVDVLGNSADLYEIKEEQMDAVCALSGSGPAFVYSFIDAMAKGGQACGLEEDLALKLATQTVIGASIYAKQSNKTPQLLTEEVCSPGGTTIEGVKVLEDLNFAGVVKKTIEASCKRSKELS